MKYALVIPDGCADEPQESLGGRTPLAAADTPAMDAVAAAGVVGRANHVPAHLPPGSDVANLSLLGYDPMQCFTGRAPLEAAAQGIQLGDNDWAIRCNLVTIQDQTMRNFTAGHISTDEATELLTTLEKELGGTHLQFIPGVSYRNLLLYRGGDSQPPFTADTRATPPHDLTDKSVLDHYPRGPGSDLLNQLMSDSVAIFAEHPVNLRRREAGQLPATNIWLWGQGRAPGLRPFFDVYGRHGAMITAVDLLRGLAALIGWRRIDVQGATGYLDTDYAAKGRAAIAALSDTDLICVHVEAPDEASHEGNVAAKIKALEEIDRHIVAPLHEALAAQGEYRLLVTPDHPTPVRTKTHSHGAVPFALAGTRIVPDEFRTYDEANAARSPLVVRRGLPTHALFLEQVEPNDPRAHAPCRAEIRRHQRRRQPEDSCRGAAGRSRQRAGQPGRDGRQRHGAQHRRADRLAREITDKPPAREMDMLLSTGEQVSVALMAMAIHSLGHERSASPAPRSASSPTASTPRPASSRSRPSACARPWTRARS